MSKTQQNTADQLKKFKSAARELGCDEDEVAFDDKLGKLAKAKPKEEKTPDK